MAQSGFSKACCTLPPVQAEYSPKGSYSDVGGLNSYVVGPENAESAILYIYDVFGFSPQVLQGADMLASQGFRVIMPDVVKGKTMTPEMFAPTEEAQKQKAAYFSAFPGAIATQSKPVAEVVKAIKSSSQSKLGMLGMCWGYKVGITTEAAGEFSAIATAHPSFPQPSDAEIIHVPLLLLPSSDEDMSTIHAIHDGVEAKNPGKNFLKQYSDCGHGFAAARADLKNPKQAEAFHQAYTEIADFFKEHL
ncbi:MAG: hypothetical protein TREMPRED_001196 [Tremellales sp. Tagirdzhanova-0007]|nr:MAG: hypothetical protein TREMPRED_001196 [Tremellales sp. Tagirdzhanova-0007]